MIPKLFFPLLTILALIGPSLAWNGPLSTRGRYIIDTDGNRFRLKSGNWHGASGTWEGSGDTNVDSNHHSNENSHNLPLGLQYAHIDKILDSFQQLKINSIRLPFSNEMIHDTNVVQDGWVAANPQFRGLTPLQVYDEVVKTLTARGFAVILNNHTNRARWCCGVNDGNERWNKSQSDDAWINDWLFMVRRYAGNTKVVGADLYNEVRRDILDDPNWGLNDGHDWYRASFTAGDRILAEANGNILIIVEGINWAGIPVDGFYHHRPTLEPVRTLSHALVKSNKLVYSAHFYDYTGPSHSGATGTGETSDRRYRDYPRNELWDVYTAQAGYVAFDGDKHYTAPVWISEFGINRNPASVSGTWFQNTIDYLVANELDFAYWPLVGYLGPNNNNGWGLVNWNPTTGARDGLYDGADGWRAGVWNSLVNPNTSNSVPGAAEWAMLYMDNADAIQSLVLRSRGDWDSGARKGSCPDGLRLIGVSRGATRGLCTDAVFGNNLWAGGNPTVTVWDERYYSGSDWAGGFTKYQCPGNHYVVGFAVRGSKLSTVLCAQAGRSLGTGTSYTRWFDQGDNYPSGQPGGDFHSGQYKGVCNSDEYIAGIAFTTRVFANPAPAAILCRK